MSEAVHRGASTVDATRMDGNAMGMLSRLRLGLDFWEPFDFRLYLILQQVGKELNVILVLVHHLEEILECLRERGRKLTLRQFRVHFSIAFSVYFLVSFETVSIVFRLFTCRFSLFANDFNNMQYKEHTYIK